MAGKRKKIPKQVREAVWKRQYGGCIACINRGTQYHHVLPVSLGGNNSLPNIVLLCEQHHSLLHLGDLDTVLTILEYGYYLKNGELPTDIEQLKDLAEKIKKEHLSKSYEELKK